MLMTRHRYFAIRTIRNGSVKIGGLIFKPKPQHPYDGRLDGLRYAFGLYWIGDEWQSGFVELWGSEALKRCQNEEESRRLFHSDPMWVDGRALWEWWESEEVGRVSPTTESA